MRVFRWEDKYGNGPWHSDILEDFLGEWFEVGGAIDLDDVQAPGNPSDMPVFRDRRGANELEKRHSSEVVCAFPSRNTESKWIDEEWAGIFQLAGLSLNEYEVPEDAVLMCSSRQQLSFATSKATKIRTIKRRSYLCR